LRRKRFKKGPPYLSIFLVFVLIQCITALIISCEKEPPKKAASPVVPASVLFSYEKIAPADFSDDGERLLFTSDREGVSEIYVMEVDSGQVKRITFSDSGFKKAVAFFPDGGRILYLSDPQGDENLKLFVSDMAGSVKPITGDEGIRETFIRFSSDGGRMFTMSNRRDKRAFEIFSRDTSDFSAKLVFENDPESPMLWGPVSAEGRMAAAVLIESNRSTRLFLVGPEEGAKTELLAGMKGRHSPQLFSTDGKILYVLTDAGSEYIRLVSVDVKDGSTETVFAPPHDVLDVSASDDGSLFAARINKNGKSLLYLMRQGSQEGPRPAPVPEGSTSGVVVSRDGSMIASVLETDISPPRLYLVDALEGRSRMMRGPKPRPVVQRQLIHSRYVEYKSRDGLTIPAYLYLPEVESGDRKLPAVIYVHGGPGGQTRYGWHPNFQLLAARGYAVLAINNRGSRGYGKTFFHADDRRHGKGPVEDCIDAARFLKGMNGIDGNRIAAAGRSYGGFLVLAALASAPGEFAAGVDISGVTDWINTLEQMPLYWDAIRKEMYDEMGHPEEDEHSLTAISPISLAERIESPLMVVQGALDVRVKKSSTDRLVRAVRARGTPVHYLLFRDEGHGFGRPANRALCWQRVAEFLDCHLKGVESVCPPEYDETGQEKTPPIAQ